MEFAKCLLETKLIWMIVEQLAQVQQRYFPSLPLPSPTPSSFLFLVLGHHLLFVIFSLTLISPSDIISIAIRDVAIVVLRFLSIVGSFRSLLLVSLIRILTFFLQEYADGLSIPFLETSAKTGADIEKAFQKLTDEVLKQQAGGWGGTQPTNVIRTDYRNNAPTRRRCQTSPNNTKILITPIPPLRHPSATDKTFNFPPIPLPPRTTQTIRSLTYVRVHTSLRHANWSHSPQTTTNYKHFFAYQPWSWHPHPPFPKFLKLRSMVGLCIIECGYYIISRKRRLVQVIPIATPNKNNQHLQHPTQQTLSTGNPNLNCTVAAVFLCIYVLVTLAHKVYSEITYALVVFLDSFQISWGR